MSQDVSRPPAEVPFNERLWLADACDLADQIIESPLGNDRSTAGGNRHLWDADWPNPDGLTKFRLTRTSVEDNVYYRLNETNLTTTSITDVCKFSQNGRGQLHFVMERLGRPEEIKLSPAEQRKKAEKVTRYLMTAEIDRSEFFREWGEMIAVIAENIVQVETISYDPLIEAEFLGRPDENAERSPFEGFYATIEKLCDKYDVRDEVVRQAMDCYEERLTEQAESGNALPEADNGQA